MSSRNKTKRKEGQVDLKAGFSVRLDLDKIDSLASGSCFIHSSDKSEPLAVCKEGRTIKIFKVVKE